MKGKREEEKEKKGRRDKRKERKRQRMKGRIKKERKRRNNGVVGRGNTDKYLSASYN